MSDSATVRIWPPAGQKFDDLFVGGVRVIEGVEVPIGVAKGFLEAGWVLSSDDETKLSSFLGYALENIEKRPVVADTDPIPLVDSLEDFD